MTEQEFDALMQDLSERVPAGCLVCLASPERAALVGQGKQSLEDVAVVFSSGVVAMVEGFTAVLRAAGSNVHEKQVLAMLYELSEVRKGGSSHHVRLRSPQ